MIEFDRDIDPESNFYNTRHINCEYYTEGQANEVVKQENRFSMIHFNSRSMYKNFDHIIECLNQFSTPFGVIAVSESWISEERGVDFELEGYDLNYVNRNNKRSGGTALYIDNNLNYKVVENMSTAIKGICECITVEIDRGKEENILVSCVYRAHFNHFNF